MAHSTILQAAVFAAEKHKFQTRKADGSSYIVHPLGVADTLTKAGITDDNVIIAAILHDTVEDTDTTIEELKELFGDKIASIVDEVTDDKSLGKGECKRAQIEHVRHISVSAKLVKLADKLYNCLDLLRLPPPSWDYKRVQGYIVWSKAVLSSARGINTYLDEAHDAIYAEGTFTIGGETFVAYPCKTTEDEKLTLDEYLRSMDFIGV